MSIFLYEYYIEKCFISSEDSRILGKSECCYDSSLANKVISAEILVSHQTIDVQVSKMKKGGGILPYRHRL